jgi:hypothetical protein
VRCTFSADPAAHWMTGAPTYRTETVGIQVIPRPDPTQREHDGSTPARDTHCGLTAISPVE